MKDERKEKLILCKPRTIKNYLCFLLPPSSFLLLLLIAAFPCLAEEEQLIPVKGLIHLNSDVSSGDYCPEELVKMAREKGVRAVFLTEDLNAKWEYGVAPFRNIVKKTVAKPSLLTCGTKKYARRLAEIRQNNPGISVMMSAEVSPFYFWTGSPFRGRLTLNDWDRQLLVMGLNPPDYEGIPTLANGSFARYGVKSIFLVWPLVLIVFGAISLKKKHSRYYIADTLCWFFIAVGVFFALRNFPFKEVIYDQYHGRPGAGPYQAAIDYVDKKGGMTFWSSPEVRTEQDLDPVDFVSPPSLELMRDTHGYTGFACFYEGYRSAGGPGGVWDRVLEGYCRGERSKPVWAIGEMSFHGTEGSFSKDIDEVQTVFLVNSNKPEEIISAMRLGRMYAVRRTAEYQLQLDSFTVEYQETGKEALMGEELEVSGPVTIKFKVGLAGKPGDKFTAKIIRAGEVIKEFILDAPGEIEYKDKIFEPGKKVYYRLDIRGTYPNMLFSNPVFVRFKR